MHKIGRNEPCRCGSGKKYKKCCMMKDKTEQYREASLHAHQGAVGKAIQWLERRFGDEIQDWIQQEWFGEIDMDEVDAISTDMAEVMNINAMEMMLAEGSWVDDFDEDYKFMDRVLGQGGPLMNAEQRQYLQTLQKTPLRLWEVTDVLPGVGLTLTDYCDNTCVRKVRERTASTQLRQWDVIGARPLQVPAGHWEFSGALYHFPRNQAEMLKQYLAECLEGVPEDQQASTFSDILAYDWLTMMLNPQPDIPDDVRQQLEHDYKRKHYAAWPDTGLPALSGKTPLEAVGTAKGRDRVIRLLKDFENSEVGAEPPFDFGFLWQALRLDR